MWVILNLTKKFDLEIANIFCVQRTTRKTVLYQGNCYDKFKY